MSRRRRPGASASNFWFYKSPELLLLIICRSRGDVSASEIPAV